MRWWALPIVLATGCYEIADELAEEAGSWSDHTFELSSMQTRLVVGGYGQAWLNDACTPEDNEECTYDSFSVTEVSASGQVHGWAAGGGIQVNAHREPGSGTITVTAMAGAHTATASIGFSVLLPEAANVRHYCKGGVLLADGPLAPPDGDVRIHWTFVLDGRDQPGDSGMNYVDAPAFTFVALNSASAVYRSPALPGVYPVRSTLGASQFDYEIYDPATATLATEVGGESFRHDGIEVGFRTAVGGRITCIDPPGKQVTSLTPDVCLIRPEDSPLVATTPTKDVNINVAPIAAGSCSVELAIPSLGLAETQTFDVTPFPPEGRLWDRTCSPTQGTRCGVMCPHSITDEAGCEWAFDALQCSDPAQLSCTYKLYLSHGATCTTAPAPRVDEAACWAE